MPHCLAERIEGARNRLFIGRDVELAAFEAALHSRTLPFNILYIHGLGGVGKSSLLHRFEMLAHENGTPVLLLDGHSIDPNPAAFLTAYNAARESLQGIERPDFRETAERETAERQFTSRHVLFIDTYEALLPLDSWLRESFLPQQDDDALVVLAGRNPPSRPWRTDAVWQVLMHTIHLENLNSSDSRAYLAQRAIPTIRHDDIVEFTGGHPLALSLAVDLLAQRPGFASGGQTLPRLPRFEATPDIIRILLEHLVQEVPSTLHRHALEACAMVRQTTEDLMATLLDVEDAHEVFHWLRELSFIESTASGLFPHDLARKVLVADLRWRNPNRCSDLHRRARHYYRKRLAQTSGLAEQRVLFDYVFLQRGNPEVQPFLAWDATGELTPGIARSDEQESIVEIVRKHEGEESAGLCAHWLQRQPHSALVLRGHSGEITGLLLQIALQDATLADLELDPAARAAWKYMQRHSPPRPGESVILFRFWMATDTYQDVSEAQSALSINVIRHCLNTPNLAYSFLPCADATFWDSIFEYVGVSRLREADFQVGGHTYSMYSHDWRTVTPLAWLERMAAQQTEFMESGDASSPIVFPHPLSHAEFAAAVMAALKNWTHPTELRHNPLLHSRLVQEMSAASTRESERVNNLRDLIEQACSQLQAAPREAKFYRALQHTYFQPAPTQEQAAEDMDLPFSTFRRHLKAGIAEVTELLWQREIEV